MAENIKCFLGNGIAGHTLHCRRKMCAGQRFNLVISLAGSCLENTLPPAPIMYLTNLGFQKSAVRSS